MPKARITDAGDSGENDHYDQATYNDLTNTSLGASRRQSSDSLTPAIEAELNIAAGSTPDFIERNKPGERSVLIKIDVTPYVASSRERGSGISNGAIRRRDIPLTVLVVLTATALKVPGLF